MRRFYALYEQTYSNLRPLLFIRFPQEFRKSKKFGHCTLEKVGQKDVSMEWTKKEKKSVKKNFAATILDHFWAKMFKLETTSFQYFSPRIPKLKKFGHPTLGSGGNKFFNGTLKVNNWKKIIKKKLCLGDFRPFLSTNVQIWDHFFPLLSPRILNL